MSGIVPYVASELAKPQNAAMAVDLIGEGINLGKKMYQSQQQGRQAKRAKTKVTPPMKTMGKPPGHSENKRTDQQVGATSMNNKLMKAIPLIAVQKDVSGDENISKRSRDTIHHKGVKICFMAKNRLKEPVFFNWAIIIPKADNSINALNILRGDETERDQSIDNSRTYMDLRCLPINSDRYRIVKHKRFTILFDSDKDISNPNEGCDMRVVEEYIRIDRQIFFDGDIALPLTNVWMVWWCDFYGSAPGALIIPSLDYSYKLVNYFKEVN